ncbi:excinuclease ABC subunit UvrA [Nocardioides marmotae]|uniref:excinuclease ABC subunit UvrA n=1 Tax=Nocardioides marmotae TaxID=2663857 RepID=UPI0012B65147|nr:excinuclease ABC subunit UvrA [Nocardioides marmotae]MBC9732815.1 excinuclease ABC subunit UvrA [Nocardioides marmotae]MTB83929.1 ABC transporter [Nocardioides marmotae]
MSGGQVTSPEALDGCVRVRGASEHNLKDVDVDLPRDAMVAFTGVSGSGKSSLAFGTLYAEAQRRYFESVAPYARRLLQQVGVPHVEEITGLPPAVALQQRRGASSSRSTVGTITTLSNLLRILYSRAGTYPEGAEHLAAEAFSPNTAAGACPECHGAGVTHDVTEDLLVPDPSLSIREGAIAAWPGAWQAHNLRRIVKNLGIDVDRPWRELAAEDRQWLLFTEEQPRVLIRPQDKDGGGGRDYMGTFRSARRHVQQTLASSPSEKMRARMLAFVSTAPCRTCGGSGLRPEALAVTFAGLSIAEANAAALSELVELLRPEAKGDPDDAAVRISADLVARIEVLLDLGLGYLSLGRGSTTLSPGEAQRLRIATQLRSGLFGVVYVLDEPSAGLHPADAEPLLAVLDRLKAAGNTLFVVEHDMDVVRRADWVVDIGPGAGEGGGQVLYSGPVPGLADVAGSLTAEHLFGRAERFEHEPREPSGHLRLEGVTRHNLADVTVDLPLGAFTAVTGPSGSGKSTLVVQVLAEAVRRHLGQPAIEPEQDDDVAGDGSGVGPGAGSRSGSGEVGVRAVHGLDQVDRLVLVDQRPIGRTPRSNLATYTGLFDAVRKVFAATPEARERGYGAGRFSFNTAEGRCPTCEGEGFVSVELVFLPSTYAPCPTCHGARYDAETLEVTYRGRSIADVLAMAVDEAAEVLADVPAAARGLRALQEVGLGYLRLGQPATELSGGEAQRIKLATELQRVQRGHTLYVLDEPTAGLHPSDTDRLVRQLHRLVDAGNTVVLVEHDLDTIATADRVVDLGPGGGDTGGRVVAEGTPREVAAAGVGATAPYLARRLDRSS